MSQNVGTDVLIDDYTYTIYMLPPKKARKMLVSMAKIIGPALGAAVGEGSFSSLLDKKTSDINVGAIIGQILERIDDKELDQFCEWLASVTHVDGKPLKDQFEFHFLGRIGAQFEWLAAAIKVNFSDFFPRLGRVISGPQGKEVMGSLFQST